MSAKVVYASYFLLQILDRLAQLLRCGIRQLVVFPELIEYLLFLHVGGKLLLLKACASPLKLKKLTVSLLRVLVSLCASSLKFKALIVYLIYLGFNALCLGSYAAAFVKHRFQLVL